MNKELLEIFWREQGLESKGVTLDDFIKDMEDESVQNLIYTNLGLKDKGIEFKEFQSDLGVGGTTQPATIEPNSVETQEPQEEVGYLDYIGAVLNDGVLRGKLSNKFDVFLGGAGSIQNMSQQDREELASLMEEVDKNDAILGQEVGGENSWIMETLEKAGSFSGEIVKSLISTGYNAVTNPVQTVSAGAAGAGVAAVASGPVATALASTGIGAPVAAVLEGVSAVGGGFMAAMAAASGDVDATLETTSRLKENAAELGIDLNTAEGWEELSNKKDILTDAITAGRYKGLITGVIESAGGALAPGLGGKVAKYIPLGRGVSKKIGEATVEGITGGVADVSGSVAGNIALGEDVDWKEQWDNFKQEAAVEFFAGGVQVSTGQLLDATVNKKSNLLKDNIINSAINSDKESFIEGVNQAVESGIIDGDRATQLIDKFDNVSELLKKVPEEVIKNKSDRREIIKRLIDKSSLEDKIKNLESKRELSDNPSIKKELGKQIKKSKNILTVQNNELEYLTSKAIGGEKISYNEVVPENVLSPNKKAKKEPDTTNDLNIQVNGETINYGSYTDGETVEIGGEIYTYQQDTKNFKSKEGDETIGVTDLYKRDLTPKKIETEKGDTQNLTPLRDHYGDTLGELDTYEDSDIIPSKQINIGNTDNADYATIEDVPKILRDKLVKTDNFFEVGDKRSDGYRVELTKGDINNLLFETPTTESKATEPTQKVVEDEIVDERGSEGITDEESTELEQKILEVKDKEANIKSNFKIEPNEAAIDFEPKAGDIVPVQRTKKDGTVETVDYQLGEDGEYRQVGINGKIGNRKLGKAAKTKLQERIEQGKQLTPIIEALDSKNPLQVLNDIASTKEDGLLEVSDLPPGVQNREQLIQDYNTRKQALDRRNELQDKKSNGSPGSIATANKTGDSITLGGRGETSPTLDTDTGVDDSTSTQPKTPTQKSADPKTTQTLEPTAQEINDQAKQIDDLGFTTAQTNKGKVKAKKESDGSSKLAKALAYIANRITGLKGSSFAESVPLVGKVVINGNPKQAIINTIIKAKDISLNVLGGMDSNSTNPNMNVLSKLIKFSVGNLDDLSFNTTYKPSQAVTDIKKSIDGDLDSWTTKLIDANSTVRDKISEKISSGKKELSLEERQKVNSIQKSIPNIIKEFGKDSKEFKDAQYQLASLKAGGTKINKADVDNIIKSELEALIDKARNTDELYISEVDQGLIDYNIKLYSDPKTYNKTELEKWQNLNDSKQAQEQFIKDNKEVQKGGLENTINYLSDKNNNYSPQFQLYLLGDIINTNYFYNKDEKYVAVSRDSKTVNAFNSYSTGVVLAMYSDAGLNSQPRPYLDYRTFSKTLDLGSDNVNFENYSKYKHKSTADGGMWVKIPKGENPSDVKALYELAKTSWRTSCQWCTGGNEGTAKSHLKGGDFYIHMNAEGQATLAIRTENGQIAEPPRGTLSGQNVDPKDYDNLNNFLETETIGKPYLQTVDYNNLIGTYLEKGLGGLTIDQLIKVPNLRPPGYKSDSNLNKLKEDFNSKPDDELSKIFKKKVTRKGSYVEGAEVYLSDVSFSNSKITELLPNIASGRYFNFRNSKITEIPPNTTFGGDVNFKNSEITEIPPNTTFGGDVNFEGSKITKLSSNITFEGKVRFNNSKITEIPPNTTFRGNVYFENSQITEIPLNTTFGGTVYFEDSKITKLSSNITFEGKVRFNNSKITKLPPNTTFGGDVEFGASKIEKIPPNTTFRGDVYFFTSQITEIPNGVIIEGEIIGDYGILDLRDNTDNSVKLSSDNASTQGIDNVANQIKNLVSNSKGLLDTINSNIKKAKNSADKKRLIKQRDKIKKFILEHSTDSKIKKKYSKNASKSSMTEGEYYAAIVQGLESDILLSLSEAPGPSAFIHEVAGHVMERFYTPEQKQFITDQYNKWSKKNSQPQVKSFNDTVDVKGLKNEPVVSEWLARVAEEYYKNGRDLSKLEAAKNMSSKERSLLQDALDTISEAIKYVAQGIKKYLGSDVNLTPEMQAFFDNQVLGEGSKSAESKTTNTRKSKTKLEQLGKTEKQREKQLEEFFTRPATNNKKEATKLAKATNAVFQSVAKFFGGKGKESQWLTNKIDRIGRTTTEDANARGDVKTQSESYSNTVEASNAIANNLINHIDELVRKGRELLSDSSPSTNKVQIRRQLKGLLETKKTLVEGKKDAKYSKDATYRAAVIESANGKLIMTALESPNATSAVHELFHVFATEFQPGQKQLFIDAYNESFPDEKVDEFNIDVEEYAARMWEQYLVNGKQLTEQNVADTKKRSKLQEIFDTFTDWMTSVYSGIKVYTNQAGNVGEVNITPQVESLFGQIMGIEEGIKSSDSNTGDTKSNDYRKNNDLDSKYITKASKFNNEQLSNALVSIGRLNLPDSEKTSVKLLMEKANALGYLSEDLSSEDVIMDDIMTSEDPKASATTEIALMSGLSRIQDKIDSFQREIETADSKAAVVLTNLMNEQIDRYELYAEALNVVGNVFGVGLAVRRALNVNRVTAEQLISKIKEANPNLKDSDFKNYEKTAKELEDKQKEFTDRMEANEKVSKRFNETAAAKAFKNIKNIVQTSTTPVKDFIKYFSGGKIKFSSTGQDTLTAEYIKNYVKELVTNQGYKNFNATIDKVLSDHAAIQSNNKINLTREDIINALAITLESKTKISETQKTINELNSQAKILKSMYDTVSTILVKGKKGKKPVNAELENLKTLRKKVIALFSADTSGLTPSEEESIINSIDAVETSIRKAFFTDANIDPTLFTEIESALQLLDNAGPRRRAANRLKKLQEGGLVDSKPKKPKTTLDRKLYLIKEQINTLREDLKSQEMEFEIASEFYKKYGDEKNVLGLAKKTVAYNTKILKEGWYEIARRNQMGGDFSMGLIQGGMHAYSLIGKIPGAVVTGNTYNLAIEWKGLKDAWVSGFDSLTRGAKDKKVALDYYERLMSSENAILAKHLKLAIIKPFTEGASNAKDDYFRSKGLGELKADTKVGKGLVSAVQIFDNASEGSYVTLLNTIRMDMFNSFMRVYPDASMEQRKEYVEFINNSTGTSSLSLGFLSSKLFTAPRLYWSRIKILASTPKHLYRLTKNINDPVSREILKRNGNFLIGQMAIGILLSSLGWEFEEDPRNPKFLKWSKGDETIDTTAGMGKWLSLFVKTGVYIDEKGVGSDLTAKLYGEREFLNKSNKMYDSPSSLFFKAAGYSLHPTINGVFTMFESEDVIGRPLGSTVSQAAYNYFIGTSTPIATQDFLKSDPRLAKREVEKRGILPTIANFIGKETGLGMVKYENNLKHHDVIKHLNVIEYDPSKSFDKRHITKKFEELSRNGALVTSKVKSYRTDVLDAVGTMILNDLKQGKSPDKETIKGYIELKANEIGILYRDTYNLVETVKTSSSRKGRANSRKINRSIKR